jgi:hypothetical protein
VHGTRQEWTDEARSWALAKGLRVRTTLAGGGLGALVGAGLDGAAGPAAGLCVVRNVVRERGEMLDDFAVGVSESGAVSAGPARRGYQQ